MSYAAKAKSVVQRCDYKVLFVTEPNNTSVNLNGKLSQWAAFWKKIFFNHLVDAEAQLPCQSCSLQWLLAKILFNRLGFLQQQFDKSIILLDAEYSVHRLTTHPPAQLGAATRHCTICLLRHTQLCGQQRLKEIALKRLFKQESWLIHPMQTAWQQQRGDGNNPRSSYTEGFPYGMRRSAGETGILGSLCVVRCPPPVKVSRWRSRTIRSHPSIVHNKNMRKVRRKGQLP